MKIYLTIIALLIAFTSFGQTAIKKSSIDSGGDISTNGTIKMTYTIGEVAVQENTTGNIHISEGFIGAEISVGTKVIDKGNSLLSKFSISPNPSSQFIQIVQAELSAETIQILDINGKCVKLLTNKNTITKIDVSSLNSGFYFVKIGDRIEKLIKQ